MICWLRSMHARASAVVRGLVPDHNPLRRRTDRIEAAITAVIIATLLTAGPLAAILAGQLTYRADMRELRAQQASRYRTTAILLSLPVPLSSPVPGYFPGLQARARWTAPDGSVRTGLVSAPAGARPGSTVTVWEQASGRLTGPPVTPVEVTGDVVMAVFLAVLGLCLLLEIALALARTALARRRAAAWEAEWAVIEPLWTSRR